MIDSHQRSLEDKIQDLMDELDNLSDWESDFVLDMCDWEGNHTDKQAERIEKIWSKCYE